MIHIGQFSIMMPILNTKQKHLKAYQLDIDSIYFRDHTDSLGINNFSFWLNSLSGKKVKEKKKEKSTHWEMYINRILAGNIHIIYKNNTSKTTDSIFNSNDIEIKNASFDIQAFNYQGNYLSFNLNRFRAKEKSGFQINNIKSEFSLSPYEIDFKEFSLALKNSNLHFRRIELIPPEKNNFSELAEKGNIRIYSQPNSMNTINLSDLHAFLSKPPIITLNFSANINGNLKKINIYNLFAEIDKQNSINLSGTVKEPLNKAKLYYNIEKFKLRLNSSYLFQHPEIGLILPAWTDTFGLVQIQGKLLGTISQANALLSIKSLFGKTFLKLKAIKKAESYELSGTLNSPKLKAYKLNFSPYDSIKAGIYNQFSAEISQKQLSYKVKGKLDSLYLENQLMDSLNYEFSGTDSSYFFKSQMNNLNLDYNLKIALTKQVHSFHLISDFRLNRMNLNNLKLDSSYSVKLIKLKSFKSNIFYTNIDTFSGKFSIDNFSYRTLDDKFLLKKLYFTADTLYHKKNIKLYSDYLNARLKGKFTFEELYEAGKKTIQSYMPTLFGMKPISKEVLYGMHPSHLDFLDAEKFLYFKIKFKTFDKITQMFLPDYYFAPNTTIKGLFRPDLNFLKFSINSDSLSFAGNAIKNLEFRAQTVPETFYVSVSSDALELNNLINLKLFTMDWYLKNDTASMNFAWDNFEHPHKYKGDLNFDFIPQKTDSYSVAYLINLKNNKLTLDDTIWSLTPAKIRIDSNLISIQNFKIAHNNQSIKIDGKISPNEKDTLLIKLQKLNLQNFNQIIQNHGFSLNGVLNGSVSLQNLYNIPHINAKDTITNLSINKQAIGTMFVNFENIRQTDKIKINILSYTGHRKKSYTVKIKGQYAINSNSINLNKIRFYHIRTKTFMPLLKGVLSNPSGYINGDLSLSGTTTAPEIKGAIEFAKTKFTVDYLKMRFNMSDTIFITPGKILIKNFNLQQYNKTATLNGNINFSNDFSNIDFDINLITNNFQFLKTLPTDSAYFYGTANLGAEARIYGTPENINIEINATTKAGTRFYIPLSSESQISETPFLTIENGNKVKNNKRAAPQYKQEVAGMDMDLTLNVTPDAEVQLIFDEKVGDIIRAKGEGNIKLIINTNGDLSIYGDYVVTKGDYMFTLGNTLNKKFTIEKGGLIRWNGNPYNAELNLNALYNVKRVALYDLTFDENDKNTKIPAECKLKMTHTLEQPIISFGIDLPTAGEDLVQQFTSLPKDELNKQILSLLIFNKFQPLPGYKQEAAPKQQGVEINTTEMLTNQLSHWLSQISNDLDIGINYQSGDSLGGSELEVEVSTQLLNERLIINSNIGVTNKQQAQNAQNIVGDMEIEYKIDKSGKFRAKAFTKTNNNQLDYEQTPYSYGIGIFYRHQFDKLFPKKKKKKNVAIKDSTKSKKIETQKYVP